MPTTEINLGGDKRPEYTEMAKTETELRRLEELYKSLARRLDTVDSGRARLEKEIVDLREFRGVLARGEKAVYDVGGTLDVLNNEIEILARRLDQIEEGPKNRLHPMPAPMPDPRIRKKLPQIDTTPIVQPVPEEERDDRRPWYARFAKTVAYGAGVLSGDLLREDSVARQVIDVLTGVFGRG